MRKFFVSILIAIMATSAIHEANAQNYSGSKYYNPASGRLDYSRRSFGSAYDNDVYYGLRLGVNFSDIMTNNKYLANTSGLTGLNFGLAAGYGLSVTTPIFLETGLYYSEKGGEGSIMEKDGTHEYEFNMHYLQVPLVAKYIYEIDSDVTIQPYVGGYLALGVGGRAKDYDARYSRSTFGASDPKFQRFDGGLRFGCGIGYDILYAEFNYDLGLANLTHNDFDDATNSAITLSIGVNF